MIFNTTLRNASVTSAVWLLAIIAVALAAGLDSLKAWLMISVFALGSVAVLLHLAREMPKTTSQTIHDARR